MNTQTDCFSTFDLNLTACIVALGHPLEKIQKTEGNRSQFLFQRSQKLESDVTAYWKQDLLLNPHTIFDSLKFIKSRLYSDSAR
ncbi:MAG: DUF5659 domain-containing protein [Candidatus Margulisiibacteriota bacterium]